MDQRGLIFHWSTDMGKIERDKREVNKKIGDIWGFASAADFPLFLQT